MFFLLVQIFITCIISTRFLVHTGAVGQSEWAELFPDCGGSSQSPINVDTSRTVHDPSLVAVEPLGYNQPGNKPFTLFNNGHTGKS